jgi:intraflagellar transport protein 172
VLTLCFINVIFYALRSSPSICKRRRKHRNITEGAQRWEDALRVAKAHGTPEQHKEVAWEFSQAVGGSAGLKALESRGLQEESVKYAIQQGKFAEAFNIAEKLARHMLPYIHEQYAMAEEDAGCVSRVLLATECFVNSLLCLTQLRLSLTLIVATLSSLTLCFNFNRRFQHAEEEFLKANKPREAIEMYLHLADYARAMHIATSHDPQAVLIIHEKQAAAAAEQSNFKLAETHYVSAKMAESAVKMYQGVGKYADAKRVAKVHCPSMLSSIDQHSVDTGAGTAAAESSDCKYFFFIRYYETFFLVDLQVFEDADVFVSRSVLQRLQRLHVSHVPMQST